MTVDTNIVIQTASGMRTFTLSEVKSSYQMTQFGGESKWGDRVYYLLTSGYMLSDITGDVRDKGGRLWIVELRFINGRSIDQPIFGYSTNLIRDAEEVALSKAKQYK